MSAPLIHIEAIPDAEDDGSASPPAAVVFAFDGKEHAALEPSFEALVNAGYHRAAEEAVAGQEPFVKVRFERTGDTPNGAGREDRVIAVGARPWREDPFSGDWLEAAISAEGDAPREAPFILRLERVEIPDFLFPAVFGVFGASERVKLCKVINQFYTPARVKRLILEKLKLKIPDQYVRWPHWAGQDSVALMRESPVEDAWLRRQAVTVQIYLFPIRI